MAEAPKTVFCVRNQVLKDADEHRRCLYCFRKDTEVIEGGDRVQFCDYDPASDPEAFGFPPGSSRNLSA